MSRPKGWSSTSSLSPLFLSPDTDNVALELLLLFFTSAVEELFETELVDVDEGIKTSSPLTALSLVSIWLNRGREYFYQIDSHWDNNHYFVVFVQNWAYLIDAVGSSWILIGKQKIGLTFNSDKLGGNDFTKFSKLTMCSA